MMNSNKQKEPKPLNKEVYMSIYGKRKVIHIWRNALRVLNFPKYFAIKKDKQNKRILVMPCEANDILSFRLHEDFITNNDSKVAIQSKPFVTDIMNLNNLDKTKTYIINGVYLEKQNLVVFNVDDAVLYIGNN